MKLLLAFALGALATLAVERAWRWLTSAPEIEPQPRPTLPVEEPPAARTPITTYCPWCVRAIQLADPTWRPEGIPMICALHGRESLILSERQAREVLARLRQELGDGPFALDEFVRFPRNRHFINGGN